MSKHEEECTVHPAVLCTDPSLRPKLLLICTVASNNTPKDRRVMIMALWQSIKSPDKRISQRQIRMDNTLLSMKFMKPGLVVRDKAKAKLTGATGRVNSTHSQGWGDSYIPQSSSFTIPPSTVERRSDKTTGAVYLHKDQGDGEIYFQMLKEEKPWR